MQTTPNKLRYYKQQTPPQKQKPPKRTQQQIQTQPNSHHLTQLQLQIAQQTQPSLTFKNSCTCNVCLNIKPNLQTKQDHYYTDVETYCNYFTLLLHLTMIQTDQATKLLGEFVIPMLFFKRQCLGLEGKGKGACLGRDRRRNGSQISFIVFKSDIRTGLLQYPFIVRSLDKVSKILKTNEQSLRKLKNEQTQTNIVSIHEISNQEPSNIIHKNFFNKQIPPYIHSQQINRKQKQNRMKYMSGSSQIKKFILHEEDIYIKQEQEYHKIKESEPFCIFRYMCWNYDMGEEKDGEVGYGDEVVSKYQIFTMEGLEIYERNRRKINVKEDKERLQLRYIQSFTKMFPHQPPSTSHTPIQSTYFSQYISAQPPNCKIYQLARLQILLKSKSISKIDPCYLSPLELQQKINNLLQTYAVLSTQKLQKLVTYKTYIVIHILDIICRIKVNTLRLKWIINTYAQPVLLQCLQYTINRQQSLRAKKNKEKDQHAKHIVDYGMELLEDGWRIEDVEHMYRRHDDIQRIVQSKIQEKHSKQVSAIHIQQKLPIKLQKISKSLHFGKKQAEQVKKQQNMTNLFGVACSRYKTLDIRKSVPTSMVLYTHGIDPTKLNISHISDAELNLQKRKRLYRSRVRKSYKLRPLKTQLSPINKQQ